jgi:phage baseplate assembly protein W
MAKANKMIAFPFAIDSSGNVNFVSDYAGMQSARVRSALGTLKGERVMRPNFGSGVAHRVFSSGADFRTGIESDIRKVFADWLTNLTLKEIQIGQVELNGSVQVNVTYTTPLDEVLTTTAGVIAVNGDATIREVTF